MGNEIIPVLNKFTTGIEQLTETFLKIQFSYT